MKTREKRILPALVPVLGIAAFGLRLWLYRTGIDSRGLLRPGQLSELLLWAAAALAVAAALLVSFRDRGSALWEENFAPSVAAAAGSIVAGLCLVLSVPGAWGGGMLMAVRKLLAAVASLALVWMGICRFRGRRPFFAFPAAVTLYFAADILSRYRAWSSEPVLQEYFFAVVAALALLLYAYQLTAAAVDIGRRRVLLGAGLLGSFACFAAAAHGDAALLNLACGIWLICDLPVWQRREG